MRTGAQQGRWGSLDASAQGINFDEIFAAEGFNVADLLKIDNIVDEVKKQNDKVSEKLIYKKGIISDLFGICLQPMKFSHPQIPKLNTQHTYMAIEILTNLTEQFSQFLLSAPDSSHKNSGSDQDQVVTEDLSHAEDPPINPLFLQLLSVLDEKKLIDETVLSYFVKIMTSLSYHQPKQLLQMFVRIDNASKQLLQHFYSRSVSQWFIRLLEIEDQSSFYQKQKLILFHQCISSISAEPTTTDNELFMDKLENYETILTTLLQKIQDRFDKAKYTVLVRQILGQKECLEFLFQKISNNEKDSLVLEQIVAILSVYLKFDSNYRQRNGSKDEENIENSTASYDIKLNEQLLIKIQELVKNTQNLILNQSQKNVSSTSLVRQYLQLIKVLLIVDEDFVNIVINEQFVRKLVSITLIHPQNNILHNLVKDILIEALNRSYQLTAVVLTNQKQHRFVEILRNSGTENSKNNLQYENQFYHVFQAIVKKGGLVENKQFFQKLSKRVQNFSQITTKMQEKCNFYNKLIGGNPREEQSCWDSNSENEVVLQKLFPKNANTNYNEENKKVDLLNANSAGDVIEGSQSQHYFDCGLPLDSDQQDDDNVQQMNIEDCLSPLGNFNTENLRPRNQEDDYYDGFPLQRENSDIRISLEMPDFTTVKIQNNTVTETEPEQNLFKISQNNSSIHEAQLSTKSFNQFFTTYQNYQLDEVLSKIE